MDIPAVSVFVGVFAATLPLLGAIVWGLIQNDRRLNSIDQRLLRVETKLDGLDAKLSGVSERLVKVETRLDNGPVVLAAH